MNEATLAFIRSHANDDVRQLALQGKKNPEVDMTYALDQIAGRQKARVKIPSWAANDGIVYPPHLSMEQCSSEATARYKAQIAGKGKRIVDLTAGFGVDMAFMSVNFTEAVHVEQQAALCAISSANYACLGLQHINVVCNDGVAYLHQMAVSAPDGAYRSDIYRPRPTQRAWRAHLRHCRLHPKRAGTYR